MKKFNLKSASAWLTLLYISILSFGFIMPSVLTRVPIDFFAGMLLAMITFVSLLYFAFR